MKGREEGGLWRRVEKGKWGKESGGRDGRGESERGGREKHCGQGWEGRGERGEGQGWEGREGRERLWEGMGMMRSGDREGRGKGVSEEMRKGRAGVG